MTISSDKQHRTDYQHFDPKLRILSVALSIIQPINTIGTFRTKQKGVINRKVYHRSKGGGSHVTENFSTCDVVGIIGRLPDITLWTMWG